jgi:predicted DNA-binding transcriptional regulator AlpA
MPTTEPTQALRSEQPDPLIVTDISTRKPPQRAPSHSRLTADPLLTVDDVARRLNVSKDWVWDHSSRKTPRLPVIRMGDGTLRYRASGIEDFISERERLSSLRSGRR